MRTESRFASCLRQVRAGLKSAGLRPVQAIAALCAIVLQYGCATAPQFVHLPTAQPAMQGPVAQSDHGILCDRDPSRPGCEFRHAHQSSQSPAWQASQPWNANATPATFTMYSADPTCGRDPSRPGCESGRRHTPQWHPGQPQEQPSPAKVAAAIAVTVLAVGIGYGFAGSAFKFTPSMFMRK